MNFTEKWNKENVGINYFFINWLLKKGKQFDKHGLLVCQRYHKVKHIIIKLAFGKKRMWHLISLGKFYHLVSNLYKSHYNVCLQFRVHAIKKIAKIGENRNQLSVIITI